MTSSIEHYLPVIAASPDRAGHLALYYYFYPKATCTQATCAIGAGFSSSSVDDGAAWSAGQHLVTPFALSLLPDTSKGRMAATTSAPPSPAAAPPSAP